MLSNEYFNDFFLQMNAFFAQYPDAGAGESSRQQALETVETNIKWIADNKPQIENWLNSRIKKQ